MSTLRSNNIQNLDGKNKDVGSLVDNQTIVDRINFNTDDDFNAAKPGKVSIDASKRVRVTSLVAGTEEISGAARRDAIVVGRNITGLTDCHAFADRTIMDAVTDAGTYGVFDATTRLRGSNNHNHLYSFQHRCIYEGSGALQQFAGLLSRPVHAGTGSINESYGADIGGMSITGSGTISQQYGVRIRDQVGATANVGMYIDQVAGSSIYAPGGGSLYLKGRALTPRTPCNLQERLPLHDGVSSNPLQPTFRLAQRPMGPFNSFRMLLFGYRLKHQEMDTQSPQVVITRRHWAMQRLAGQ
jgi:hypothetical protein